MTTKIKDSTIESFNSEKLQAVTVDSNFSFDNRITDLGRKTSQKIHELSRVASYMTFHKNEHFGKYLLTLDSIIVH